MRDLEMSERRTRHNSCVPASRTVRVVIITVIRNESSDPSTQKRDEGTNIIARVLKSESASRDVFFTKHKRNHHHDVCVREWVSA